MDGTTWDRTAEPFPRGIILKREWEQRENIISSVLLQVTASSDSNYTRVVALSAEDTYCTRAHRTYFVDNHVV